MKTASLLLRLVYGNRNKKPHHSVTKLRFFYDPTIEKNSLCNNLF